jgi:hypothetical protein
MSSSKASGPAASTRGFAAFTASVTGSSQSGAMERRRIRTMSMYFDVPRAAATSALSMESVVP